MLRPSAAELRKFRQGDDLIAKVKILNSTDRNRLVIAEVERVSVRARIDADLVYVEERTTGEVDGILASAAEDRIVAMMRLDMEGVIAGSSLQRRIGTRNAAVNQPELVVARTALHDIALHANQRVVSSAAEQRAVPLHIAAGSLITAATGSLTATLVISVTMTVAVTVAIAVPLAMVIPVPFAMIIPMAVALSEDLVVRAGNTLIGIVRLAAAARA